MFRNLLTSLICYSAANPRGQLWSGRSTKPNPPLLLRLLISLIQPIIIIIIKTTPLQIPLLYLYHPHHYSTLYLSQHQHKWNQKKLKIYKIPIPANLVNKRQWTHVTTKKHRTHQNRNQNPKNTPPLLLQLHLWWSPKSNPVRLGNRSTRFVHDDPNSPKNPNNPRHSNSPVIPILWFGLFFPALFSLLSSISSFVL